MNFAPKLVQKILEATPDTENYVDFKKELKRIQKMSLVKNPREDLLMSITIAFQKVFGGKQPEDMNEEELKIIESFIGKPRQSDKTSLEDNLNL